MIFQGEKYRLKVEKNAITVLTSSCFSVKMNEDKNVCTVRKMNQ